jgi:LacI family kdg operon repressor
LRSYNIEGLIVNTLGHHRDELLELHREMPLVLVDRKVEHLESDMVGLDNPQPSRWPSPTLKNVATAMCCW